MKKFLMNIVTKSRKNETPDSIKDCLTTDEITKPKND